MLVVERENLSFCKTNEENANERKSSYVVKRLIGNRFFCLFSSINYRLVERFDEWHSQVSNSFSKNYKRQPKTSTFVGT